MPSCSSTRPLPHDHPLADGVLLLPLLIGILSGLVAYIGAVAWGMAQCQVPHWLLAVTLIDMPGNEMVYAAEEIFYGSIVLGTCRLLSAMFKIMYTGLLVTLGWQVFGWLAAGQFADSDGSESSGAPILTIPYTSCPTPVANYHLLNIVAVQGIYITMFVILGIKAREILFPLIPISVCVYSYAVISNEAPGIGGYAANTIALFIATAFAGLLEYVRGVPSAAVVSPCIIVLAPGSSTLMRVFMALHVNMEPGMATEIFAFMSLVSLSMALGHILARSLVDPITNAHMKYLLRGEKWKTARPSFMNDVSVTISAASAHRPTLSASAHQKEPAADI